MRDHHANESPIHSMSQHPHSSAAASSVAVSAARFSMDRVLGGLGGGLSILSEKDLEYCRSGSGGCWLAVCGLAGSLAAFDCVLIGRVGGGAPISAVTDGRLGGRGGGSLGSIAGAPALSSRADELSLVSEALTDPVLSTFGGSVRLAGGTSSYDDLGSTMGAMGLVISLLAGDPGGGGGARRVSGDGADAGDPVGRAATAGMA